MAYEFKKLSEVESLDTVPEGASVLAEVGGVIKRVPGEGLGGSGTIPEFDLAAMGLPAVPIGGEQVSVECDTTEIMAAMEKGLVKLNVAVNMGGDSNIVLSCKIITAMGSVNGNYSNTCLFMDFDSVYSAINFNVNSEGINAQIYSLALA